MFYSLKGTLILLFSRKATVSAQMDMSLFFKHTMYFLLCLHNVYLNHISNLYVKIGSPLDKNNVLKSGG